MCPSGNVKDFTVGWTGSTGWAGILGAGAVVTAGGVCAGWVAVACCAGTSGDEATVVAGDVGVAVVVAKAVGADGAAALRLGAALSAVAFSAG
ncbi:hypothetical protein [Arthrobacter sp. ZGTC131]|uniref:hypothetical protein n=1 Tax=Arthrobacter sp. ZGTC131 TaxID=2058898 RepID=UPI0011B0BFC6|nr:hypothetical protein [Arthrobacter sp. ZGTC131]